VLTYFESQPYISFQKYKAKFFSFVWNKKSSSLSKGDSRGSSRVVVVVVVVGIEDTIPFPKCKSKIFAPFEQRGSRGI
jgi:hypothetical protein